MHVELWWQLEEGATEPSRAHPEEDAGFDLFALEERTIVGRTPLAVRTGVRMALPHGWYARIVGRSSALLKGIEVFEGIIDCGYRGELLIKARPLLPGGEVVVQPGESIGQLIVCPVPRISAGCLTALPLSERGENGFGSSGN